MSALRNRLVGALLGVIALPAAGCSSLPSAAEVPACSQDAECGDGQICFEDGCGSALDVAALVTPNNSAFTIQDFNPVDVRKSRMDLTLQDPAVIEGRLLVSSKSDKAEYADAFSVTARGTSINIPGVEFPPIKLAVAKGPLFSIAVPPGLWQVTATPADKKIPPAFAQKSVLAGAPTDPGLVLSGDAVQIDGHVVKTGTTPWKSEQTFRLTALDPASGILVAQPQVSSTQPPDLTPFFSLFALRSTDAVIVRVSPDGKTLAPTKDFRTDASGKLPDPLELGDFGEPLDASIVAQGADGSPIVNAAVHVEGQVPGGGTFANDATPVPGTPGTYTLKLLAPTAQGDVARYKVTVHPPQDSAFFTSTVDYEVNGPAAQALKVPPVKCFKKFVLTGQVNDVKGKPVAGVAVSVEGNTASLEPGRTIGDTTTSDTGEFHIPVEPGAYRVVVKPGYDRKLPWSSRRVTVLGDAIVGPIVLSEPRMVEGALETKKADGSMAGIGGARVEIYRALRGERQPGASAIKLYDAVTDSSGKFKVILPRASGDQPE